MSNIALNIIKILRPLCETHENKMIVPQINNEAQVILPVIPQTPSTPTQIMYPEDTTTNSTVSTTKDDLGYGKSDILICFLFEIIHVIFTEKDGLILTAWIQWTITKVTIKLYIMGQTNAPSLKLMLELEDIITSLDLQSVYLQLKSKITTATIFHYIR